MPGAALPCRTSQQGDVQILRGRPWLLIQLRGHVSCHRRWLRSAAGKRESNSPAGKLLLESFRRQPVFALARRGGGGGCRA
jgi:hypothetical protein